MNDREVQEELYDIQHSDELVDELCDLYQFLDALNDELSNHWRNQWDWVYLDEDEDECIDADWFRVEDELLADINSLEAKISRMERELGIGL